jgi:hypothetical protein
VGLQQLVAGQEQQFQPLCTPCHELKTNQSGRTLSMDFLASHFEKSVWEAYVTSPRPPPAVCVQTQSARRRCSAGNSGRCSVPE